MRSFRRGPASCQTTLRASGHWWEPDSRMCMKYPAVFGSATMDLLDRGPAMATLLAA